MKYVLWALSLVMLVVTFWSYWDFCAVETTWVWPLGRTMLCLGGAFIFAIWGVLAAEESAVRSGKDWDRK